MSSETLLKTPLFASYSTMEHVRLVDFGGWELPLEYGNGIVAEHNIVRSSVGIFDVSHMGEILIEGPHCMEFLNWVLTNDVGDIPEGKAVYSPMCYPDGGTVDDLLVYQLDEQTALLVVNAANTGKDFSWLSEQCPWPGDRSNLRITDVSGHYVQIAVQGPESESVLSEMTSFPLSSLHYYQFSRDVDINGKNAILSRTGYTGEDGFEMYLSPEHGVALWDDFIRGGITPVGLGARDTLRLEARLPLYGHELSADIMPIEAGLSPFVCMSKEAFCGREAMEKLNGNGRTLRGIKMVDAAVPRQGYTVELQGTEIGIVTSGGKSPTLGSFIALACVERGRVRTGDSVDISIRGKLKKAIIVKIPFYRNVKKT